MHKKNVRPDGGSAPNHRSATENGGIRVDGHMIPHFRVALTSLHDRAGLVLRKTPSAESDSVIEFHTPTDAASLPDNDTCAVVDEKTVADARAGVDVDAGLGMHPLADAQRPRTLG